MNAMSALKTERIHGNEQSETYYNIHCSIDIVNEFQKKIPENKTPVLFFIFFTHSLTFHTFCPFTFGLTCLKAKTQRKQEDKMCVRNECGKKTKISRKHSTY